MITQTTSTLLFYYPVASLLEKAEMHSGLISRMLPGVDITKYALSSDETVFFHSETNKNLRTIYGLCHKLSIGIASALIFNEPSTQNGTDHRYGFYVNNNEGLNINSLYIIDGYIESLLLDMLLKAWWLKCGLADQYKVAVEDVRMQHMALNNSLYSLYNNSPNNYDSFGIGNVSEQDQNKDNAFALGSATESDNTSNTPHALGSVTDTDNSIDTPHALDSATNRDESIDTPHALVSASESDETKNTVFALGSGSESDNIPASASFSLGSVTETDNPSPAPVFVKSYATVDRETGIETVTE